MVTATRENSRKAWAIADFLNKIGNYSARFFLYADDILERCRDEAELCWWYQKLCSPKIIVLDGVKK